MYQFAHWKCRPSYELGKTARHNIKYNELGTIKNNNAILDDSIT